MEKQILLKAATTRPAIAVPMWPNRRFKRVGEKAFRCLLRGTKVPGRVKELLGDERLKRLRILAVAQKLAAA